MEEGRPVMAAQVNFECVVQVSFDDLVLYICRFKICADLVHEGGLSLTLFFVYSCFRRWAIVFDGHY